VPAPTAEPRQPAVVPPPRSDGPDPVVRASLLRRLGAVASPFVDEALRRIVREVPGYHSADALTEQDLRRSFRRCLELVLVLVLERRDPTPEELHEQAHLGGRRAEAGLEVADLTRAYRLGFLVVWSGLAERAREDGPQTEQLLAQHALRVWELQDRLCSAIEDAHRARQQQLQETSGRRGRALLDALRGLPDTAEAAERAARAVGMRPDGRFVAAVVSGAAGRRPFLPGAVTVDEDGESVLVCSVRGAAADAAENLADELERLGWSHVGVGLCLTGLDGARQSLRLARRAHDAGRRTGRRTLSAGADWFACMVGNEAEHLEPVLAPVRKALADDEDLAATVAAFLAADRNLTRAAARLFLHPNTVAYRIRRLADTTGLDLRTLDGLVRAHTALTLLGRAPEA
jgi:hypothetical protein